jgi:hypothetical protein
MNGDDMNEAMLILLESTGEDVKNSISAFFEFTEREWNRLYYGQGARDPIGIISTRDIERMRNKQAIKRRGSNERKRHN